MTIYRDITLKRQAREARKQDKLPFKRAVLVDEFGNQTSTSPLDDVWASESERRVWHMTDGATQPSQILCRKVSDPYVGLGVIIGYADGSNQLDVLSDDFFLTGTGDPTSWASTAPRDFEPGGRKMMWVYTKVITPLATYPGSGISVNVIGGDYPYLGTRKTYAGSLNFALISNPNPGEHYLAGLYLDAANTLQVVYGASVVVATTPPEPTWPAGAFRLSAVRINDTQTSIDFADDVFDRRMAWSDEIAGTGDFWPYDNIYTVSQTNVNADYSTIAAAAAAVPQDSIILIDSGQWAEDFTLATSSVAIVGLNKKTTVITSATDTVILTGGANALYNLTVVSSADTGSHYAVTVDSANCHIQDVIAAKFSAATLGAGIWHKSGASLVLDDVDASSTDSTSNYGYYNTTNAVSAKIFGGSYTGDTADIYSNQAGSTLRLLVTPNLINGLVSHAGTHTGRYTDATGNMYFLSATGESGGAWLYDANGLRVKYDTLLLAAAAAGAGDIIHLFPGTYTLTAQLAYGAAFAIEGEGPETIINCATNSIALLLLNSAGAALRNLKITHSGAGILNSGVYITADATVENVTVQLTGAATANYPVLQQGGTATLTNVTATASGATTNHAYRNDTSSATVTINGGSFSGAQADIYGDQAASTLATYGTRLANGTVNYAGIYPRQSVQPTPTEPILINGHPLVWQRGTSFATAASGQFFADRFAYFKSGDMVHTLSQSSDVPTIAQIGAKFNYSMLVDCTTVDAAIAAGDFAAVRYVIEGYDFLKIAQQQFTLPFWVKATKTGVYCVAFRNSGSDRSYVVEYTVNTTDTWEYKQVTVTASPSAGTWDYTTGIGMSITWALAVGSTFQAAASGDWETGNFFGTANQVNACDDTANNFRLIVGDPVPGPYARPIVTNPYGNYQALLDRCLRYAYGIDASSNTANQGQGAKTTTTNIQLTFQHPVPMRAATTLTHNISGYTAGNPGTTTIGVVNYATNNFYAITGALTVARTNGNTIYTAFDFTAGTSWGDTAGNLATLRVGPSVVTVLSAEL